MASYPAPMCWWCKRLQRDDKKLSCEAFPEGVPDAIVHSAFDHRKQYADETLLYDPVENAPPVIFDLMPSG